MDSVQALREKFGLPHEATNTRQPRTGRDTRLGRKGQIRADDASHIRYLRGGRKGRVRNRRPNVSVVTRGQDDV